MGYDLINIKKYYSETLMHLCRELFPTLLEQEGLLFSLLESKFAHSKFLGEDIINEGNIQGFKNYILSLIEAPEEQKNINKSPKELLEEAGYILYECKNEEDIQSFKKYYKDDEELCTFRDNRLKDCYVFFAVKKNVDSIKREAFSKPIRQDEYGTSVISIQFSHGNSNTLSIKNRYNHNVSNPDATFSNNLDNIIPGLTKSFEKDYNLNITNSNDIEFELEGYVLASDGKYYKYNYEINNIYYCPDNIIIDNFNIIDDYTEKEKYIIMDYFVVDLVNKRITLYDNSIKDCFLDGVKDIKKIEVTNEKDTKTKKIKLIFNDDTIAFIELDKINTIISYENENLMEIGDYFLYRSECIENINIPNVIKIGDEFLRYAFNLTRISLPYVEVIGHEFITDNDILEEIYIPKVEKIGNNFLGWNLSLKKINCPKLKTIGDGFISSNECLEEINIPKIMKIGDEFLRHNNSLTKIDFPLLKKAGNYFCACNGLIKEVNLSNLMVIENNFLSNNKRLIKIDLPNLQVIGNDFMSDNNCLTEINLPMVNKIGSAFLYRNNTLTSLNLPKVECICSSFLYHNNVLNQLDVPVLKSIESSFLAYNNKLKTLKLPMLKQVGDYFLGKNQKLRVLYAPELCSVGNEFMWYNLELCELDLTSLQYVGSYFLGDNNKLKFINVPKLEIVGSYFLYSNNTLKEIVTPNLISKGVGFLYNNKHLKAKTKMLKL